MDRVVARYCLHANNQTGRWAGPAFYNVGAASVGFQAGVAVSETVTLVMTEKGMNSLLATSVKLGGDVSVAAGPIGAGANSDVTTDLVAFSRAKGIYGGLNLEGSVIDVADNWNQTYYGTAVLPPGYPHASNLAQRWSGSAGRRVGSRRFR